MRLLIQNGQVYDGASLHRADVLMEDGVITGVARGIAPGGATVVEAAGCVVSGAFTDLHTHLRQPGFEAKETVATGTAAAAAGGFTTVCAMPNLNPVPDSLQNLRPQLAAIEQSAKLRVLPLGAITVGQQGDRLADLEALGAFVPGFTDDGRGVQSGEMMRRAMQAAGGRLIAAHCELSALLPPNGTCVQAGSAFAKAHGFTGYGCEAEWREVERNIRLCEATGCRLHICHASAARSFELVRSAKRRGLPVSCEVTPHNLLLSCDDITEDDGRYKMNPPLRGPADVAAARAALLDGTVNAVATDHAPHTAAEKAGGFANSLNGVVGLETAFPALYTGLVVAGLLSLPALLDLFCAGPRAVLGEEPPAISPGQKAELVVLDMESTCPVEPACFLSKGRSTPFAGHKFKGWPKLTVLGDAVLYQRVYEFRF